jgi:hypothetical protein
MPSTLFAERRLNAHPVAGKKIAQLCGVVRRHYGDLRRSAL